MGTRLLSTMGSQRERFGDHAAQLQRYTGIGPVTKKSGGSCRIHRRYLCPKFHRQSFHEYAKESILWSRWAAAYHLQQRAKGNSHHTAVRALAFKWQRIIWRCWQDRRPYDKATYRASLKQRHSPIVDTLFDRVESGIRQKPRGKIPSKKLKKSLPDHLRGELSHGAKNRKREFASNSQTKEQPAVRCQRGVRRQRITHLTSRSSCSHKSSACRPSFR